MIQGPSSRYWETRSLDASRIRSPRTGGTMPATRSQPIGCTIPPDWDGHDCGRSSLPGRPRRVWIGDPVAAIGYATRPGLHRGCEAGIELMCRVNRAYLLTWPVRLVR
jgi:hypothetical protein